MKRRKIIYLTNFIFNCTFFHIAFHQIVKNGVILINHEKNPLKLDRFQFFKINSLMAETIKKNIQNKIFINKLLNLIIIDSFSKIGNGQVADNLFSGKMIYNL